MGLVPVSAVLGKKGRFEHVFLTVSFKKLKPMATPDKGLII